MSADCALLFISRPAVCLHFWMLVAEVASTYVLYVHTFV